MQIVDTHELTRRSHIFDGLIICKSYTTKPCLSYGSLIGVLRGSTTYQQKQIEALVFENGGQLSQLAKGANYVIAGSRSKFRKPLRHGLVFDFFFEMCASRPSLKATETSSNQSGLWIVISHKTFYHWSQGLYSHDTKRRRAHMFFRYMYHTTEATAREFRSNFDHWGDSYTKDATLDGFREVSQMGMMHKNNEDINTQFRL